MKNILILILFIFSVSTFAQNYALTNGTIYTITNGIIENGTVLISNGKIEFVGTSIQIPENYLIINCEGLRIYPGLFDSGTSLGLVEIGSLPETRDNNEVGEFNPNMEAITAINPNSELIPVTRVNGITTVLAEPSGNLFNGQSCVINLFGYTPEAMSLIKNSGMHLNFPSRGRASSFDKTNLREREKRYDEAMKKLNSLWEMAENYVRNFKENKSNFKSDIRFDPFIDLFNKKYPLIINVNRDVDILRAIDWVKEKNINIIFSGVNEGWRVAEEIAKAGIPCLVGPVLSVPTRQEDRYDAPYTNAEKLRSAGVKFAFRTGESSNVRNLPYNAASAVAYGMPYEEALKGVTIYPAQIFGVENLIGSIENGKIANIVVTDNDILEVSTEIKYLFINGFNVSLENRHTKLYEEFKKRKP